MLHTLLKDQLRRRKEGRIFKKVIKTKMQKLNQVRSWYLKAMARQLHKVPSQLRLLLTNSVLVFRYMALSAC